MTRNDKTIARTRELTSTLVDGKYVAGLILAALLAYWTNRADDNNRIAAIQGAQTVIRETQNDLRQRLADLESYVRDQRGK